jgi:hypothetical protein
MLSVNVLYDARKLGEVLCRYETDGGRSRNSGGTVAAIPLLMCWSETVLE